MSMETLTRRVAALEARLRDIEDGFASTIYRLERRSVRNEMAMTSVLAHLGLPVPTEEEIDNVLDES